MADRLPTKPVRIPTNNRGERKDVLIRIPEKPILKNQLYVPGNISYVQSVTNSNPRQRNAPGLYVTK